MSDPFPPSEPRIYFNAGSFARSVGRRGCGFGIAGMVIAVFVLGGLLGLLISGWKVLLGL